MAIYATSGGSGSAVEVITVNTSGAYVSGGGGGGSTPTGTPGTPTTDVVSVQGVSGMTAVKVDGSAVTQPVSAASLPLPSGASTAAKQPALGTAGTASADVITVQGIASMTALKVDGSAVTQPVSAASLPLPTGAATAAKQPALGTAGTASSDVITVQGIASMTALKVDLTSTTTNAVPVVTSVLSLTPSANFTRPSDTTAYAVGDLVANSTTAGSVTPLSFSTAARVSAGNLIVRKVRLLKSGTSTTSASFRVWLFSATPTISTTGDNGVFATVVSGAANFIGTATISSMNALADGAVGNAGADSGNDMMINLASGTTVYALIEARGAYTPSSAEVFTVSLEIAQN